MKSRPIIMSGDMAGKSHTGEKTETRRPFYLQPTMRDHVQVVPGFTPQHYMEIHIARGRAGYVEEYEWKKQEKGEQHGAVLALCPYGVPGDELWVREAHYLWGRWVKNGLTPTGRQAWRFTPIRKHILYLDIPPGPGAIRTKKTEKGWFKRNPRFMPRWASRTTLVVESIRAERLQEITEADCLAEGVDYDDAHPEWVIETENGVRYRRTGAASDVFVDLWDGIYTKKPELQWDANPWVWVIGFRRKGK